MDAGYRIGSFNMCNLSKEALSKTGKRDLAKIAEIIKKERFDVVALQEVLSEGAAFESPEGEYIKRSILMELGPKWRFEKASVVNGAVSADRRGECFAFLWNSDRLKKVETELSDNSVRIFQPRVWNQGTGFMARRPYYARFTSAGLPGGSNFELRLICVHTHYGDDSASDRLRRQKELEALMAEIYPSIATKPYKNSGAVSAYTVILGDYNAELMRPWKENWHRKRQPAYVCERVVPPKAQNMLIITTQDQLTTLRQKEDDDSEITETRRYTHDYDHFSYDSVRFASLPKVATKRVDAIRKYCDDDAEKYRETVSDHVPIVMNINLK